ncbi:chymotrypsinogen A-like [Penaeus japonicus]|uniref:chymotrypsinogen A-like n=1 Tax=Penaeus japonicus TaxID=27405 RepID=UPI001C710AA2|nr:chymotrypsinogen A-like [Penaeus japonicus]
MPLPSSRIIGGAPTYFLEYPWQVGITKPTHMRPYCGGTIISDKWILTAAHCKVKVYDVVLVGAHNWCLCQPPSMRIPVKEVYPNPDYNNNTRDNDIALLRVSRDIPFPISNRIAPVCLPYPTFDPVNGSAFATGWGVTYPEGKRPCVLRDVEIPTMSKDVCSFWWPGKITDRMLCAGIDFKGTCSYDDGGPLVASETVYGPFMQIGVTSWGAAKCNRPQVYTRVTKSVHLLLPLL